MLGQGAAAPSQNPGHRHDNRESPDKRGDQRLSRVFTNNPLVKDTPYLRDPAGRYRIAHYLMSFKFNKEAYVVVGYMGPTSTWSFFRRAITLVEHHYPSTPATPSEPFNLDGAAFRLVWNPFPADQTPDISDLPPFDYALYLFHTVQFHLGQIFPIIYEPVFLYRLSQFENNALEICRTQRLWLTEYLLVLAFGEAFMSHDMPASTPAGSAFAARAMALLPDFAQLHEEGLLGIEVLALAAIYYHSIDMRVSAFQCVSSARKCPQFMMQTLIHQ